jgi:uncharacterized protein (TIGR00661 family)
MRILYGVVGEGMGHAIRSRVVIEHLLDAGHSVRVVVSGKAHGFLEDRLEGRDRLSVEEIQGFSLAFDGGEIDLLETVLTNLELAPRRLRKNLEVYRKVAEEGFAPELVISDFESWAYLYARNHRLPVVSIDNMHVIDRCEHDEAITRRSLDFKLARAAVKVKVPGAYHYLVTSFFFPDVRKPRTTLIPPILRPEILAAQREPGDHIVVYQTESAAKALLPVLERLPGEFRVYGTGEEGQRGNVTLCGFSETGFIDDMRTARAMVATSGFSLMGEAVHLGVPMLTVPLEGQFEQELNARYLATLGYGSWTPTLDGDVLERFLGRIDEHQEALDTYPRCGNEITLACVDELVRYIDLDEPRPERLETVARGSW